MSTHRLGVLFAKILAPRDFLRRGGRGGLRLEHRGEGNLGIEGEMSAAGQVDNHIRARSRRAPTTRGRGNLLRKINVGEHSGGLHHPAQFHFTPHAARRGRTERPAQCLGGPRQIFLGARRRAQLGADFGALLTLENLHIPNPLLHHLKLLGNRSQGTQNIVIGFSPGDEPVIFLL